MTRGCYTNEICYRTFHQGISKSSPWNSQCVDILVSHSDSLVIWSAWRVHTVLHFHILDALFRTCSSNSSIFFYKPISTCLLRLGLIRCNQCLLTIGQNIASVCYLDYFFHIRQFWHEDEGRGGGEWKKPQPLCYPCNLSGVFCCRSVLGSRHASNHDRHYKWT